MQQKKSVCEAHVNAPCSVGFFCARCFHTTFDIYNSGHNPHTKMAKIYIDKKQLNLNRQTDEKLPVVVIEENGKKQLVHGVKIKSGILEYTKNCDRCGEAFLMADDYEIINSK